jgi:CBS domain-containing protein
MRSTMPRRCDIVTGLSRQGADVLNQSVDALMTRNVECCSPHDTIAEVMTVMTERRSRHLAVVESGNLVGPDQHWRRCQAAPD